MTDKERAESRRDYGAVEPTTRDEFLHEWREDPQAVFEQCEESNLPLDVFANTRAPATPDSPGTTAEWLLYNQGIRMVDTFHVPSSRMVNLPKIDPPAGEALEPEARLMNAYWDDCYNRTLLTGVRAANMLSGLETNSIWRPISDEAPFRQPQIAPAFDFMRLLAFGRRITEDTYRINKWRNRSSEQVMQELAEGTEPKLFEITRSDEELKMRNYRAGIEATDSFLNASSTRASDITNAVEEIAIGHRITLLRSAAKLIHDSRPTANTYNAKTATGLPSAANDVPYAQYKVDYPRFSHFMTTFGSAYRGNCAIGNEASITALKLMSISDGRNLSLGSWTMMPNSNIEDLNGDMTNLAYGWIDGVTELVDGNLQVFQRETTLAYVQRAGMDQDEMERLPGPRKTRRWLGTQSLFAILDPNGIREFDTSATA